MSEERWEIVICGDVGQRLVTISMDDGSVEYAEDYDPQDPEDARTFWDAIVSYVRLCGDDHRKLVDWARSAEERASLLAAELESRGATRTINKSSTPVVTATQNLRMQRAEAQEMSGGESGVPAATQDHSDTAPAKGEAAE